MKKLLLFMVLMLSIPLLMISANAETVTTESFDEVVFDHSTYTYVQVDDLTDYNLYLRFSEYDVLISTFEDGTILVSDNYIEYTFGTERSMFTTVMVYSEPVGWYYVITNDDVDVDQIVIMQDGVFSKPYGGQEYYVEDYQLVLKLKDYDVLPPVEEDTILVTDSSIEFLDSSVDDGWYHLRIDSAVDLTKAYGNLNYKTGDEYFYNFDESIYVHINEIDSQSNLIDIDIYIKDGYFKIFTTPNTFDVGSFEDFDLEFINSNVDLYANQQLLSDNLIVIGAAGLTLILIGTISIVKWRSKRKFERRGY